MANAPMASFGKTLKTFRERARITQSELANQLGVMPLMISRWENEHAIPKRDRVLELSVLLNLSELETEQLISSYLKKTTTISKKTRTTCYLASLPNEDLNTIRELLEEKNIHLIVPWELPATTTTALGGIANAISQADIFIAIFNSIQNNNQIFFELGFAIAMGLRILIVAPPNVNLPLDIAEIPSIHTESSNRDAINIALNQLLKVPPKKRYTAQLDSSLSQMSHPIGDLAYDLLERLTPLENDDSLNSMLTEKEVVSLLELAFQQSGLFVVTQPSLFHDFKGEVNQHADMVIWSDAFDFWIGNPLIIEVKIALRRQQDCIAVAERVVKYLQRSGTRSALIVYVKKAPNVRDLLSISPPNIFFLSVRELLTALRTKSFAGVIHDLRNQRVHGINAL